jgi:hypothetical protein
MLTYYKGDYNDYCVRVEPIPSSSTHLTIEIQDMTTQRNYGANFSPGQWSYSEYESFVSFSVDLDVTTFSEAPTGNEFRMVLYPQAFPSGSDVLQPTTDGPIWRGSIAFFASQSEDKPNYVNQIPLPENGEYPFKSNSTTNQYIILP